MKTEEFLDLYRQLEDALEEKYIGRKRKYSSVVIEFLNSKESNPFKDKLNLAREIRNLLSHSAKIEGQDIVTPSDNIGKGLREIITYLEKPPLAIEFATKPENILFANINQTVLKVMGLMQKNGFSHVPVLENGKFVGVFSKATIFEYVLSNAQKQITRQTSLKQLKEFFAFSTHSENYCFEQMDISLFSAIKIFDTVSEKNKRVSVIFITENGRPNERILAMLTPLDVMGNINFNRG